MKKGVEAVLFHVIFAVILLAGGVKAYADHQYFTVAGTGIGFVYCCVVIVILLFKSKN